MKEHDCSPAWPQSFAALRLDAGDTEAPTASVFRGSWSQPGPPFEPKLSLSSWQPSEETFTLAIFSDRETEAQPKQPLGTQADPESVAAAGIRS